MLARGRIFLLVLTSAVILAGCGGGEEIPSEDGEVLLLRLDEIERAFAEGQCDGAQASAALLEQQVSDEQDVTRLPADLDSDTRELIQQGARRLSQLVSEQCESPEPEPPEEPVEPPPPVEPEPVEPPPEEPPPETPPGQDENGPGGGNQGGGQGGQGGGDSPSGGAGSG